MKSVKKYQAIPHFLLIVVFVGLISCNDAGKEVVQRERDHGEAAEALLTWEEYPGAISIKLDPDLEYQRMDNFGASDCWSTQFVGNWPGEKKNAMANWLFSRDTLPTGQPLGIGLNAWRFNIGAGSAEQGTQSQISTSWRRAECFLNPDGSYDFEKQAGQQWFLNAAADRGVDRLIGFTNSPPVYITKNGLAHGSEGDPENLSKEMLDSFSKFLVDVTRGLKEKTGHEFTHLSAFNEPQWDWTGDGQEGCYMENELLVALVKSLNSHLEQAADLDTRILVSEAGEWDYLYGKGDRTGQQIDHFFGNTSIPRSEASRLENVITGHSYYTTHPRSALINKRESVWNKASSYPGLEVWASEYCPLGSADLQQLGWSNWRKDLGMNVALHVARIIHHDLVYAHASAWQWWLAISSSNYPDGLIYVSGTKSDGSYTDSKLMWTLGNYSRFIKRGATRIDATCAENELLVTAFRHEVDKELTVVLLNTSEQNLVAKFEWETGSPGNLRPYITSDIEEYNLFPLHYLSAEKAFEIPARSAITFTTRIK